MKELKVEFGEPLRAVQVLDPELSTSLVDPNDSKSTRESVRGGGPAAQLEELREQLDELRNQLERQKKTPDPALTAQLQKREQELQIEVERARATREALDGVLQSLSQAVNALRQEPENLKLELQESVIQLASLIASKLVHERIDAGEYPVEELVRQVVDRLNTDERVTVRMNPDDLKLLEERLGDKPLIKDGPDIAWEADETLSRGNCHASTGDMTVSNIVREQLALVTEQLREAACWD